MSIILFLINVFIGTLIILVVNKSKKIDNRYNEYNANYTPFENIIIIAGMPINTVISIYYLANIFSPCERNGKIYIFIAISLIFLFMIMCNFIYYALLKN